MQIRMTTWMRVFNQKPWIIPTLVVVFVQLHQVAAGWITLLDSVSPPLSPVPETKLMHRNVMVTGGNGTRKQRTRELLEERDR